MTNTIADGYEFEMTPTIADGIFGGEEMRFEEELYNLITKEVNERTDLRLENYLDKAKVIHALNEFNKQPSGTLPIAFLKKELGL